MAVQVLISWKRVKQCVLANTSSSDTRVSHTSSVLRIMNEGEPQAEIQGVETDATETGTMGGFPGRSAGASVEHDGRLQPPDSPGARGGTVSGRRADEDTRTPGERARARGDGSDRGDTAHRTGDGYDGTQRDMGTTSSDSQRTELGRSDAAGARTVKRLASETPVDTNQVVGVREIIFELLSIHNIILSSPYFCHPEPKRILHAEAAFVARLYECETPMIALILIGSCTAILVDLRW